MKLTNNALEIIKSNTPLRLNLAGALGKSQYTIDKILRDNEENNDLTKIAALSMIESETGLTINEILSDSANSEKIHA